MKHTMAAIAIGSLLAVAGLAQVTGTIRVDNSRQQGASVNGKPLLFTPEPVQLGSSVSHWDSRAVPNLLMEPAINSDLAPFELDLTDDQMKDIGWKLTVETPGGSGSTFNVFPFDDGFEDPRPFPGAPGNPATTLGEARVNLFTAVLQRWASTLESPVDIDVIVLWSPQFCQPTGGAVLAGASTTFIFSGGTLPVADTWYPAALSEALAGEDLTGSVEDGGGDLVVFMNSEIDEGCLGAGTGYYYGLDGNDPANQIDIAPVILHELGHGLGFANFVNETDGSTPNDLPSIFDQFTYDIDQARTWAMMNDDQRRLSAVNFGRVEWTGPNAVAGAESLLTPGVPVLEVFGPASAAGSYDIGLASFGGAIPPAGLAGEIVCQFDNTATGSILDGCEPATNPGALAGKIALIDRGTCPFTQKVANAQAAGAIGAIIANHAGNSPPNLGGSDPTITIPAVGVGRSTGRILREAACPGQVTYLGTGSRFQVTTKWQSSQSSGTGQVIPLTEDTSLFWFFNEANVELVIKVLDGCAINDNFWVFAGGLTNVAVDITIVDTATGATWQRSNPLGTAFQPIQDTSAFATCP